MNTKLKILFFDLNNQQEKKEEEKENELKSLNEIIIDKFIDEHIITEKKINKDNEKPENNFISFNYDIQPKNNINIIFYNLNSFNKTYSINLIVDAFFIIVDIENKNDYDKLINLISYIKDNCAKEIKSYILGIYKNEDNIINEFKNDFIIKILDKKRFLYNYQTVFFNYDDDEIKDLNEKLEDLLLKIYDNKKKIKLTKIPKSETVSYENLKDDNTKSCEIF